MLSRIFTAILLFIAASGARAQSKDTLYVIFDEGNWLIQHKVGQGESIAILAHKFHVPPSILADMNGLPIAAPTITKTSINIPVGEYNFLKSKPASTVSGRGIYYKCKKGDDVPHLALRSGIPQSILKDWNKLQSNTLYNAQVLLIGWILYETDNGTSTTVSQVGIDKGPIKTGPPVITEIDEAYLSQTSNGSDVTEEKGPAFFYDAVGKVGGPYYAFHNNTPRGTIIKVFNPGNGKTIFVKVMGPLPETKQYYNTIIGISGTAKAALGVTESRAWCELMFGNKP